jgi:hypothetical protein
MGWARPVGNRDAAEFADGGKEQPPPLWLSNHKHLKTLMFL